jgi:hypothetical protein
MGRWGDILSIGWVERSVTQHHSHKPSFDAQIIELGLAL